MGERIVVMNHGRIQQVAPPLEIYERPANEFVAGFIGTPPMNLFPAGTIDAACTVGARPEHVTLSRGGDGAGFEARVDFSEPLGPETLVHFVCFGGSVPAVARLPGFAPFAAGERVRFSFDAARAVRFRHAPEDGRGKGRGADAPGTIMV